MGVAWGPVGPNARIKSSDGAFNAYGAVQRGHLDTVYKYQEMAHLVQYNDCQQIEENIHPEGIEFGICGLNWLKLVVDPKLVADPKLEFDP